jgi:hypothetical protein
VSLAGFRVFGFVGASGVVHSINKTSLSQHTLRRVDQIPWWLASDPPMGWWLGLHQPPLLSHTIPFPCVHTCVVVSLVHTSLCLLYLIAHVLHYPPPPHAHNFVLGTAVINTHTPPWSFGFDSQTRGTRENDRENGAPPCVKVPGSSRVQCNSYCSNKHNFCHRNCHSFPNALPPLLSQHITNPSLQLLSRGGVQTHELVQAPRSFIHPW